MKRIIFLVIGTLLVLGLVLPGCGTTPPPASPYHQLVTNGTLTIGVLGDMDYVQGQHAVDAAQLAKTDAGTFSVNGTSLTVTIKSIDTDEVDNPGSASGTATVASYVPQCDFMVGGFRTEGVSAYLRTIMDGKLVFIDCGAATEELAHLAITDYTHYKYFFKGTPMNDYLLNHSLTKLQTAAIGLGLAIHEGYHNGSAFLPNCAVLAEAAEWTKIGREMAQASIAALSLNMSDHVYLVPSLPTSDSQVTSVIQQIKNDGIAHGRPVNLVITILSGPAGVTYGNTVGDYLNTTSVLTLGINVEAQRKNFPTDAKYAKGMLFLDGWADGVNMTSETATFLSEFESAHPGQIPVYTAGTYDAILTLVKAVQAKAINPGGAVQWLPDDIVSYMEGSIQQTAAGVSGVFPNWDGTTKGTVTLYPGKTLTNIPALNETQVRALWPWLAGAKFTANATGPIYNWTYNSNDWTMPPVTSHDLCYGTPYPGVAWSTGIASQWQNISGTLTKVCVWPTTELAAPLAGVNMTTFEYLVSVGTINATELFTLEGPPLNTVTVGALAGANLWDQYGWWNFEFPGTGSLTSGIFAWANAQPNFP